MVIFPYPKPINLQSFRYRENMTKKKKLSINILGPILISHHTSTHAITLANIKGVFKIYPKKAQVVFW
jgi:CRISPR/Cas system type I-B associated protein Csh2 (Cas7 group RAMP superfamily)